MRQNGRHTVDSVSEQVLSVFRISQSTFVGCTGANRLLDTEYVEPIMRFQPITTELDPLEEIDEILPIINDLARDLINQSGLQNLRVMAEPNDRLPESG